MDRYQIGSYLKALRRFETYVWLGLIIVLTFLLTSFWWWLINGRPTYLPITTLENGYIAEQPSTAPSPTPAPSLPSGQPSIYVVQPGDSLWVLAERWYGDGTQFKKIMIENNLNSEKLDVGQELKVNGTETQEQITHDSPEQPDTGSYYEVKPGDSLWKIAEHHFGTGYKWVSIYTNGNNKKVIGKNPNKIYPGQKLVLSSVK